MNVKLNKTNKQVQIIIAGTKEVFPHHYIIYPTSNNLSMIKSFFLKSTIAKNLKKEGVITISP